MSGQKDSPSLFSDQNPLFSNSMLSSIPIDWNNLSNNSISGLIDICHELHIHIKEPIIKRDLINSINTYLKKNNISSLSFSPSYNHINTLFENSPNNQKPITLSRIPESYCQQMPSISSFFGTSSSFQPLAVSPFSQILKKWKQQANHAIPDQTTSNHTEMNHSSLKRSNSNQRQTQKPIDFKPSHQNDFVYRPGDNNNKNHSNDNTRNYQNKNRNNKFQYTKDDNNNDSHQQNKVEQFLPNPKNQKQRQNYQKQNQMKGQQKQQQQQKQQIIPEPSQIVVNKNAFQNNNQPQQVQTRSATIQQQITIEMSPKPIQVTDKNTNANLTNSKAPNKSIDFNKLNEKSNLKITTNPNNESKTINTTITNKPNDISIVNNSKQNNKSNDSNHINQSNKSINISKSDTTSKSENPIKDTKPVNEVNSNNISKTNTNSNLNNKSNKESDSSKVNNQNNVNNSKNNNIKKNVNNNQQPKTNNQTTKDKTPNTQINDNPFSSLQESSDNKSTQMPKEIPQSREISIEPKKDEKKNIEIEIKQEEGYNDYEFEQKLDSNSSAQEDNLEDETLINQTNDQNSQIHESKDENNLAQKLFGHILDFINNQIKSKETPEIKDTSNKEVSDKKQRKGQKDKIIYEDIVKEKKKKRVLLSFYGISVQNQKMFFRIMLVAIHIILFIAFFCINGFQFTIPYRL